VVVGISAGGGFAVGNQLRRSDNHGDNAADF
jgi:hypothetical protein